MKYYIIGYKNRSCKEYAITVCKSLKEADEAINDLLSDNWTDCDYFEAIEEVEYISCLADKTYYYED